MLFDTFSDINSIIENDSTDTTYKYSLLKSVIESCQEYPQYITVDEENNRAVLPLGICVMKWLIYYYPFFLPGTFISMKNGEKKSYYKIVFREYFEMVCAYYEQHGGISVFIDDVLHGTIPDEISPIVLKLASTIRSCIADKPMRHLGYSLNSTEYSIFKIESKAYPLNKSVPLSFRYLIERCGTYSISKELWMVFRDLGGFILGTGSVQQKWMDFLRNANKNDGISDEELLRRFALVPESERDVSAASKIYHSEVLGERCFCVWSGKKLTLSTLAIDHMLPFSVLKSNELWNLLPADSAVNLDKSDKVPSREVLLKRKEMILSNWNLLYSTYPKRFEEGVATGLLNGELKENWMESAFEQLCKMSDYLISVRCCKVYSKGK